MTETYCGKNCAECTHKETLSCPGCKAGPGRPFSGDCSIAGCCRGKGHQECTTCEFRGNCGMFHSRYSMPQERRKVMEAEKVRTAELGKRAQVLGKWLWFLFWLIIPGTIASFMTNKNMLGTIPSVYMLGQWLSVVCSLARGVIFVRLASEEDRYRTAGICVLVSGAVSALIASVSGGGEAPTWTLLISLLGAIASLVGEYNEFAAHSTVLTTLDYNQAEKWSSLWKWNIGMYGAVFGSILLMIISPILGLLVTLAAAIGLLIVSILKLVYLYKTAKLFREYIIEEA